MFHVIDDEPTLCSLAVEFIKSAGFNAISFCNPLEYIAYMNSDNYIEPIAIFTDVQMPGMNGYELTDIIREKYPEQKIVIVSGYSGVEAFQKKVWQFLPKPYMPEQIIAIATAIVQYNEEEIQASSLKPQASSLKPQASSLKPQASSLKPQ